MQAWISVVRSAHTLLLAQTVVRVLSLAPPNCRPCTAAPPPPRATADCEVRAWWSSSVAGHGGRIYDSLLTG
jgi:hypothetical protein